MPLKALAREPFVIFPRHLGQTLYDDIVSLCGRAGFSPRIAQEASRAQTVVGLVAAGIGVALLAASCQNLRRVGTVCKPIDGLSPKLELTLAWRRDYNSPVLDAFLNVSREVAGQMANA